MSKMTFVHPLSFSILTKELHFVPEGAMEEHGPKSDKKKGPKEVPEPGLLGTREEVVCDHCCCETCRVRDRVPESISPRTNVRER